MSSERLLLDLSKHISARVADIMNQALGLVDSDDERMLLVIIALNRMLLAGSHMVGEAVEEMEELSTAQQMMVLTMIIQGSHEGPIQVAMIDHVVGRRMERAMNKIMERTNAYSRHVKLGDGM